MRNRCKQSGRGRQSTRWSTHEAGSEESETRGEVSKQSQHGTQNKQSISGNLTSVFRTGRNSTPPSRDGTGRRRLVRMKVIKVLNESRVNNVLRCHPRPLLRTVPLPVYQVLTAASSVANCQEAFDRVHRTSIDDPGRRR